MKKILFVCASLKVGGAEKSLVNLLNMIDYKKYSVELLLFQKQGGFYSQIPKEVRIVDCGKQMRALYDKVPFSIDNFKLKCFKYISTAFAYTKSRRYDIARAHRWEKFYKDLCEPLKEKYDVAIAFQSGEPEYFVMDKVEASRKVVYFHTDISNIKLDHDIESRYLEKFDRIISISNKCVQSITDEFPEFKSKTTCLENLSSFNFIKKMAGDEIPSEYDGAQKGLIILSVGRLVDIKGYDMAIDAANILEKHGIDFRWFFVGEGPERRKLERQIKRYKLEKRCHLIGLRSNPYPYMKFADVVVQSSRYEGKSVVIDEAKILEKLIVITDYASARDQICDGENGLITDMSGEGIAFGIERLYTDKKLVETIKRSYGYAREKKETADVEKYCTALFGD